MSERLINALKRITKEVGFMLEARALSLIVSAETQGAYDEADAALKASGSEQPNLEAGLRGKKEGMRKVQAGANPAWKKQAKCSLVDIAKRKKFLAVDDLRAELEQYDLETRDLRALGPVMMWGARERFIEATEGTKSHEVAKTHGTYTRVWKSLLWEG